MGSLRRFETVNDYNIFNNHETLHPHVGVLDLSKADPRAGSGMYFGLYAVFLKDVKCGDLTYGRETYDYQEGTLVFVAPGQVVGVKGDGTTYQPKGHALVFHPDLIHGTALAKSMHEYAFFGYGSREALHLSEQERRIVMDCLAKIEFELKHAIDRHSRRLIVSNIELFLNYCTRFYDRQFITREHLHSGVLEKFEVLLNGYFNDDSPRCLGFPSVSYFADQLHLSAGYFGTLIKKHTGISAQEYIHNKIIEIAKVMIRQDDRSVIQIATELGFRYPQHFTRLFKQRVGVSPREYRHAQ